MTAVVSLSKVVGEMEIVADEIHAYLNKETGEIVSVTDEEIRAIEDNDNWSEYPEWQQDSLAIAQKILRTLDYIPLPSKFDIGEYSMMESFCNSIEDVKLSNELANKIRGSGAFRRFKDAIYRHNIEDDWYEFRDQALEEVAIDWLESHGIAYTKNEEPGTES